MGNPLMGGLRWAVHDLALAVQFLTRIPVPLRTRVEPERLAGSVKFYPVVGAVLGAALAAWNFAISRALPPLPSAGLTLALWVILTGAMHLDGLMDSADGLLSNRGRERSLEIMKDSRSGPMGVVAAVAVLLVKFSAIASLGEAGAAPGLIIAPVAGRLCLALCLALFPYARKEGMGAFSGRLKAGSAVVPMVLAGAVAAAAGGAAGAVTLLLAACIACAAAWRVSRFLGGLTGDVYGAVCEVSEAVALILWIALRGHWGQWP